MQILAIETTGPMCSVALLRRDNSVTERMGKDRMNHLKSLTPMIAQMMKEENVTWQDIERIAVSVGPGSFTGIRIGVSTGRALSQMTGIPLVAVETLAAFGLGECAKMAEKNKDIVICPIFDARRQQVYGGAYGENRELVAGGPYMLDEFLMQLVKMTPDKKFHFVGNGLRSYEEAICRWAEEKEKNITCDKKVQRAEHVALLAKAMMNPEYAYNDQGSNIEKTRLSYNRLKPRYMRQAEAQRQLEKSRHKKENRKRRGMLLLNEITIRRADSTDIDALTEMDHLCFTDPWSRESYRQELEDNAMAYYFIAEAAGEPIGFAGLWKIVDEGHITNVAVCPGFRRHHAGKCLVEQLIKVTEKQGIVAYTLEVRATNQAAICLYRQLGFETEGRRRGYYADNGEDALIMWKRIETENQEG